MNKSKFLKKSLAAILSVLLIVAMIPLSAAAAETPPSIFVDHEEVKPAGNTYSITKEISPKAVYISTEQPLSEGRMVIQGGLNGDVVLKNEGESNTIDITKYATVDSTNPNLYTLTLKWYGPQSSAVSGEFPELGTYTLKIDNSPSNPNRNTGINRVNLDDGTGHIYDPSTFVITDKDVTITLPFGADIPAELKTGYSLGSKTWNDIFEPNNANATVAYSQATVSNPVNVADGTSVVVGEATVTVGGLIQRYPVRVQWQVGFTSFNIEGQEKSEMGTTVAANLASVTPYVKVTMPFGTAIGGTDTTRIKPTYEFGPTIWKGTVKDRASSENRPMTKGMTFPALTANGADGNSSYNYANNQTDNTAAPTATLVVGATATMTLFGDSLPSDGMDVTLTVADVAQNPKAELTSIQVIGLDHSGISGKVDETGLNSNVYENLTAGSTMNIELPKTFAGPKAQLKFTGSTGAKVEIIEQNISGYILGKDVSPLKKGEILLGDADADNGGTLNEDSIDVVSTKADENKTVVVKVTSEDGQATATYRFTFVKAAAEEARLTTLKFTKGTVTREATITGAPKNDKGETILNVKVPYTWKLADNLAAVQVYAAASTGSEIVLLENPNDGKTETDYNNAAKLFEFHDPDNRGAAIGAADGTTTDSVNDGVDSATTTKNFWTVQNLFQTTGYAEIKLTVHNSKASVPNNTYIVRFIADKGNVGHGITSGALTDTNIYSSVTENNTYTLTPGTAKSGNATVQTLELKLPYSFNATNSNTLYGLDIKTSEGAKVIMTSVNNSSSQRELLQLAPEKYGAQTDANKNFIKIAGGTETAKSIDDMLAAYNSTSGTIDTSKATPIWVINEEAHVDNAPSTGLYSISDINKLVTDGQATIYYMYAVKADPETGHELESIESTLDPNVLVHFNKAAQLITIDVPQGYLVNAADGNGNVPSSGLFSLNFKASKLATVAFVTPTGGVSVGSLVSDLGSKATADPTKFYVYGGTGAVPANVGELAGVQFATSAPHYPWSASQYVTEPRASGSEVSVGELIVTAEDTRFTTRYKVNVTVSPLQEGADILEVKVGNSVATISGTNIELTVPAGTDLTKQKLAIKASRMATVQINGVDYGADKNYNLATPLTITVDSESGVNHNTYHLTTKTATSFVDVPAGIWFEDAVKTAAANGWIKGTSETTFEPYRTMTRKEFALIIARMDNTFVETATVQCPFPDVTGTAYQAAARYVYDHNIMQGDSSLNFNPDDPITREQAAIVLCNLKNVKVETGSTTSYVDNNKISSWAIDYVKAATDAGYFQGDNQNAFAPQRSLMRCEGATILVRSATK